MAAGASAFARHYWELVNYTQATGDVSALDDVAADGCESCTALLARVRDVYQSQTSGSS